jgi:hypothetical protein
MAASRFQGHGKRLRSDGSSGRRHDPELWLRAMFRLWLLHTTMRLALSGIDLAQAPACPSEGGSLGQGRDESLCHVMSVRSYFSSNFFPPISCSRINICSLFLKSLRSVPPSTILAHSLNPIAIPLPLSTFTEPLHYGPLPRSSLQSERPESSVTISGQALHVISRRRVTASRTTLRVQSRPPFTPSPAVSLISGLLTGLRIYSGCWSPCGSLHRLSSASGLSA